MQTTFIFREQMLLSMTVCSMHFCFWICQYTIPDLRKKKQSTLHSVPSVLQFGKGGILAKEKKIDIYLSDQQFQF